MEIINFKAVLNSQNTKDFIHITNGRLEAVRRNKKGN